MSVVASMAYARVHTATYVSDKMRNMLKLLIRFHGLDPEALVDACADAGIAFLPWQPIVLTPNRAGRTVAEIASGIGAEPGQVALAWLLRRSPVILPIPGTSKKAHLDANLDAAWLQLPDDAYARIDDAAAL